eukprot:m.71560 g.71560  ORF g.71560 m.71560 type:complete len:88 (-) comp14221_c0_seq3:46-309(-)
MATKLCWCCNKMWHSMWMGMKQLLCKAGTLLVTCPSLETSLSDSQLVKEANDVAEWAEKLHPALPKGLDDDDEYLEEASSLHFYRIR